MTDKTYNGWANHATWLINIWTDGDDEIARISHKDNGPLYDRTQELKVYIGEAYLDGKDAEASLMADLLSSVLCDVDWYELVRHYEDYEVDIEGDDSDKD